MKKPIQAACAAAALCIALLSGCASGNKEASTASQTEADDTTQIVCATFPAYDWARQVVGDKTDNCEIIYLTGNGVDLHSYQPSVEDIATISDADLFIYVGGESDEWALDAVEAAANPDLHAVNMMEVLGDRTVEEEVVEGMEADEHEHEDEEHEHEEGEEGPEYDEHVWLSLKNAQLLVDAIADELAAVNPDNADAYHANAEAYNAELAKLDADYATTVKEGTKDTILFADRFPFRYLVVDYDLSYYAAFVGCSAETEASFETVAFLAEKVDELELNDVLVIENSDQKIAETVIQNTKNKNQKILVMDSLQSTTDEQIAEGRTYLTVMENNRSVLAEALA